MQNIRHGDLALIGIKKLPSGLKVTNSKIIMHGSHDHDHAFNIGKLYLKKINEFVIGYFEAIKGTKLFHPEHGEIVAGSKLREAKVPVGFYELRVQNEDTNEGMKQVID